MKSSQKDLDIIERYLNGILSEKEEINVRSRLDTDAEFKDLYYDYIKGRKSIDLAVKNQLKEKVNIALRKEKKVVSLWIKPLSIAAGLLIIIVGSMWIFNQGDPSPQELYAEYYASPPTPNMRSQDSPPNIQQAFIAYQNQNYISADTLLARLLEIDDIGRKEELILLRAGTLMELNREEAAIKQLKLISSESALFQDAQWYLLLAYLKMGNTEQAKNAANDILSVERHFKTSEAAEILKSLD